MQDTLNHIIRRKKKTRQTRESSRDFNRSVVVVVWAYIIAFALFGLRVEISCGFPSFSLEVDLLWTIEPVRLRNGDRPSCSFRLDLGQLHV